MTNLRRLTSKELLELLAVEERPVVIHLSSPLASSCEVLRTVLVHLSRELGDWLSFAELEVPLQDSELIDLFKIEELPTLLVFREGAEVERLHAIPGPEALREFLREVASFYLPVSEQSPRRDDGRQGRSTRGG